MLSTSEGFEYTPTQGSKAGLPTQAVISPPTSDADPSILYDVIIIGAGYTGLTAARDLTAKGRSVLLLEARDRIGGRTWTTVTAEGDVVDLGGAYVHWHQPLVWSEIVRYGLKDKIKDAYEQYEGSIQSSVIIDGVRNDFDLPDMDAWLDGALQTFYNADGAHASELVPYPHTALHDFETAKKYDSLSVADRLDQVRGTVSQEARRAVELISTLMSGPPARTASYYDLLQRWVLGGATHDAYTAHMARYKLSCGQTELAKHIFDDAVNAHKSLRGNDGAATLSTTLSYSFSTPVETIDYTNPSEGRVQTTDGRVFRAKQIICTIPLTVLKDVAFVPTLPDEKTRAFKEARANNTQKAWMRAQGKQWRTWAALRQKGDIATMVSGDAHSASPDSHTTNLIYFSGGSISQTSPKEVVEDAQSLHPDLKVDRMISTDWVTDPYSRGTWSLFSPGYMTTYLAALQEPLGNLKFASSDYCDGWRGFIDGAIEVGMLVAREVDRDLES
ncbi:hypothetical protein AYO21_03281 [Fonsecaea monophora]|uniref:Amine oxidase n=1 Tax=Fonsecaea monophora TaxID=254056 RepID=A0A177FDT8_9EURO|nr:hypothetical protein AYO21_03281 [Fonsecaea monophora]KAH0843004.1 Monoamine oxidase N [Fonsecaea pedrosoi]OAG42405.1 hypothetical protein AYO21_03281 [Fonsecaea monophora]